MAVLPPELQAKLHLMTRISTLLNSSLKRQEVVDNALVAVEQVVEAETSSIFGVDRERGELYFLVARGQAAQKFRDLRLKIGEGLAGWVALTEKPLLVNDVRQDPRFYQPFDAASGFTTRSALCIPLKARDRLLGVLELLNKKGGGGFTDNDQEVIGIVANQIGVAWDNALLYRRLQERLNLTVAELKVTRSRLFQAERQAALSALAQGVAHEVRNPVMIIGGYAHLLQKHLAQDDHGREALDQILAASHRLEVMVREVESFCAMPEPQFQVTDLGGVLNRVLEEYTLVLQNQSIHLAVTWPPDLPPIAADSGLISEALGHLIANAAEAMPGGGELRVALALEPARVVITLADTGSGIAPQDLPHLFDPFFSTKPQGTGMGLIRAYRIAAAHNGELRISSESGHGATVVLTLPRWQPEVAHEDIGPL